MRMTKGSAAFGLLLAGALALGAPAAALADEAQPGWSQDAAGWHYVKADGTAAKGGWLDVDGTWYLMDASGTMLTGWQQVGGAWYYLKASGAMETGWLDDGGTWYYLKGSGAMATGWQQVGGSWYWLGSSGAMRTGWYTVDGEWNWSDANGVWHANSWERNSRGWWYSWADGTYPTSSWQLIGGSWYHFDSAGYMQTGWLASGGNWYYLAGSGAMQTGWLSSGGSWYYLNADRGGAMAAGWQQIDGSWYYFDGSGVMATGYAHGNGKWYYLDDSGKMVEGWRKIAGSLWQYYNPSSGEQAFGWKLVDGSWYYFAEDRAGFMQRDSWIGDYYVGSDGRMVTDSWVGDRYVGADGKWIPDYQEECFIEGEWSMKAFMTPSKGWQYLSTPGQGDNYLEVNADYTHRVVQHLYGVVRNGTWKALDSIEVNGNQVYRYEISLIDGTVWEARTLENDASITMTRVDNAPLEKSKYAYIYIKSGSSDSNGEATDAPGWSQSELSSMKTYLDNARKYAVEATRNVLEAQKQKYMGGVVYLEFAVEDMGNALNQLEEARKLAESNDPITLTDGSTLSEKIETAIAVYIGEGKSYPSIREYPSSFTNDTLDEYLGPATRQASDGATACNSLVSIVSQLS